MQDYRIVEYGNLNVTLPDGMAEDFDLEPTPETDIKRGYFHQWVTIGPNNEPHAIVETKTGEISILKPHMIRFTTEESNPYKDSNARTGVVGWNLP